MNGFSTQSDFESEPVNEMEIEMARLKSAYITTSSIVKWVQVECMK